MSFVWAIVVVLVASTTPAAAQLPRAAVAHPSALIESIAPGSTLTLIAHHVALRLDGPRGHLHTQLTWRNAGESPIAARYTLPLSATLKQIGIDGDDEPAAGDEDCGDDDLAPATAEIIEAGEADPRGVQAGTLWLAPGDEVTIVLTRDADVFARAARHRIVLPLTADESSTLAPQFSAQVQVHADAPIVSLVSATHGGDVDGLGERDAQLVVDDGRGYEKQFFAVEYELDLHAAAQPRYWGGETRGLARLH